MDVTTDGARDRGYDQVKIPRPDGSFKALSRREFESLPLRERVSYLIDGTARFFRNGQQINAVDAMKG
jgi:hypothetical protein